MTWRDAFGLTLLKPTRIASGYLLRWTLRMVALASVACAALAFGYTLYAVGTLERLQPWHVERLREEFSALRHSTLDLDGYIAREEKLFAELEREVAKWNAADEGFAFGRYNPHSASSRLAGTAPYNRTFRLTPASPRGGALLLHGLTDSPYSMLALARVLYAQGFEVTVMRMPGHGTVPAALTEVSARDWRAAVRIGVRGVAVRVPPDQPFILGGYSTGATMALQHVLETLGDAAWRRPDRLLLLSPAIELTRIAQLSEVIDFLAVVPVPVLEKVRWQTVLAEFDPYKYNSFPVNAARQVNRATRALAGALAAAQADGTLAQLPPITTWQSVVDATVGSTGVIDTLYARLDDPRHRLVMFDVNRADTLRTLQRPGTGQLLERLRTSRRGYVLEIVSNAAAPEAPVLVHRLAPDGSASTRDTGLTWPASIVSLSHVALPFPPADPIYGYLPGSGQNGVPSIGSWMLRGERGALTIPLDALTRLRSNPFWSLIEADVIDLVRAGATGNGAGR
jgi:alpha-beta hydrolase superfamily lysophospholipase